MGCATSVPAQEYDLRPPGAKRSNDIDGDHVVAIFSERVSEEYLAFLRERGVSYLLARAQIDGGDVAPRRLTLATVEQRADDVVWLRYRVE
jgi:hypothetical protein